MSGSPHIERNAAIYRRVVAEGETLAAVGADYGLSRNRVHEIVCKISRKKHGSSHSLRWLREQHRAETD